MGWDYDNSRTMRLIRKVRRVVSDRLDQAARVLREEHGRSRSVTKCSKCLKTRRDSHESRLAYRVVAVRVQGLSRPKEERQIKS